VAIYKGFRILEGQKYPEIGVVNMLILGQFEHLKRHFPCVLRAFPEGVNFPSLNNAKILINIRL